MSLGPASGEGEEWRTVGIICTFLGIAVKRCKCGQIGRQKQSPGAVALQAFNFIKKETLVQVFHVNFTKFLRTPFL